MLNRLVFARNRVSRSRLNINLNTTKSNRRLRFFLWRGARELSLLSFTALLRRYSICLRTGLVLWNGIGLLLFLQGNNLFRLFSFSDLALRNTSRVYGVINLLIVLLIFLTINRSNNKHEFEIRSGEVPVLRITHSNKAHSFVNVAVTPITVISNDSNHVSLLKTELRVIASIVVVNHLPHQHAKRSHIRKQALLHSYPQIPVQ